MPSYTTPTQEELLAIIRAGWNTWLQDMDTSDGSPEYHLGNVIAQAVVASMGNAKALHRDINPLYSSEDDLSNLASLYGLTRVAARGASDGEVRVTVTGTGSWLATQQWRSADGITYQADTAGSWSASGNVDIPFSAVDTGAATTKAVGTTLTTLSPPSGMSSVGTIQTAFTTIGLDQETDEELRERLLNLLGGTGNSGNRGDFVRWMTDIDEVAEGYVYKAIRHILSVDGTIFGHATVPGGRWLTSAILTDVNNYINGTSTTDGQRAVGQDFLAVLPTAQDQAVDVEITPDDNYGRDWGTAASATLTVSGISTDGTFFTVTTDPSSENLVVGDRVAINIRTQSSASHYHLEVRTVTNIVGSGSPWSIYVDTPFTDSTGTGPAYPAGPTTEATVTAIEGIFDSLGPADDATGSRWPLVSSERPTDLVLADLNRSIMDVEVDGVRRHLNTSWTTPASDVTATASALSGSTFVANAIRLTTTRIRYDKLNT